MLDSALSFHSPLPKKAISRFNIGLCAITVSSCRVHLRPPQEKSDGCERLPNGIARPTSQRPRDSSVQYPNSVAIIDDDEELRRSLGGLMRAYGIEARLFESADAFLASGQTSFDCVIVDVHMPGVDGISMTKRLRERGNDVPVIIISALDPDRTRDKAMAGGAQAYFSKPIDSDELLDVMAELMSSRSDGRR